MISARTNRAGSHAATILKGAVIAMAVAAASSASAHHGFGNFDLQNEVTVAGKVKRLDFVNPHSYVYIDVPGPNGTVLPYRCEMRAATVLRRSGWSPELFKPGEEITISGAPDRFDAHSCYVQTIAFADGTKADRYAQLSKPAGAAPAAAAAARPARLPSGEPNISGDWAPEQVVMTDPRGRSGSLVPVSEVETYKPGDTARPGTGGGRPRVTYTAEGQKAADAFRNYNQEDNPRMRCETTSILFDWTFDGPVNRITQSGNTITLQYGQLGLTRTIHMDQTTHPANVERTRAGHSIGKWENDVLVVDTAMFAPGVLSPPIRNSDQLHTVERFTFDPAALKITRAYTAEDPVYFTDQYTGSDTIGVADLPYAPDKCEELTFVDFSGDGTGTPNAAPNAANATGAPAPGAAAPAAAPATPTAPAAAPAAPAAPTSWWKFWEWF